MILICETENNNGQLALNQLTTQQALVVAARACNCLLFGQPEAVTFDRVDLSETITILTNLAITFPQQAKDLASEIEQDLAQLEREVEGADTETDAEGIDKQLWQMLDEDSEE